MNCKICSSPVILKLSASVLNKYDVRYYKCTSCGFMQTDEPFWLSESYSSAITNQDLGLLSRNITFQPIVSNLISLYYNTKAKYLDFGGGYGVFVRLMRDHGYDFYILDTYCENLFAKRFEFNESQNYELVTAFEVFEHLENPREELDKMLSFSKNIFFSTELQPKNFKNIDDWWYIMPETGQHIAFYTEDSLKHLAKIYNLNFYTNGKNLHLITEKKINPLIFKVITQPQISKFLHIFKRNKNSLLLVDYNSLVKSS